MGFVRLLADRHDVGHGGLEFLLGQFHVAGKGMEVANKGCHDLAQTRIFDAFDIREAQPK